MTEEKKSMVPKLRFPGFNETWEQRKLGDFAEKVTEKNTELRYSEVFTNSAEFGVIRQRDFFDHDIAQLRSLHGYYVVKEDDFVYNPRISVTAPVGPINRNKLGKTGVVSPLYTVLRTQGINREFLEWFFKSSCWYPFMLFNGDSGARSDRFSIKNALFFRMPIALPCQAEQMKIGLFFERLDKAITLHQRKLEGLSKLKKSLLQKMFPKNGQQNPEVRFPGFTEAWEQRKLGDFAEKVTEKNTELRYSEVFTNSAEFGVIRQRDFFDHDIAQLRSLHGYYVVKEDDFVYNPRISVTAPVGPINRNKLGKTGVVSPLYTVLRTQGINREFLEWFFKSSCWYPFMLFNGDSGARSDRFSIKNALFFRMPIALPCQAEQMKIGLFFERLDKAITLHQRKLESLKILKKSVLQQMFV